MPTHDISRHLFTPGHHYTGTRVQQRRPILDSDINAGEQLDDENLRKIAVSVIGPHGSPDQGFAIGPLVSNEYEFPILAGSYYLGGMRFQMPEGQFFHYQRNWLQYHDGPAVPAQTPRWDLVYLVGWEQDVCSLEDRELQEQALGGPDAALRVARMQRVLVRPGAPGPADCVPAFDALVAQLKNGIHSYDATNCELVSGARLSVVQTADDPDNACVPPLQRGYTGAENQAIRIQLIGHDSFLWGRDDGAPLYRIDVPISGQTLTITFQTPPRDHAHYPQIDQVLEILPWGAELANFEHTADEAIADDIGGGLFARITQAYDPATRTLKAKVTGADKAKLEKMSSWFNSEKVPSANRFLFTRVWNPGDAATPAIGIKFQPDTDIPLIGTGLKIRFNGPGIIGDHWILAARPATPHRVVPWQLMTGAAPHGPRRFYCPLAMIHWPTPAPPQTALAPKVHSCRQTFRPLTQQGGCCTVTVGDGETSHGDYSTITAALAALHPGQAAKICILPGLYQERVILSDRHDIVLEGCGARTVIRTPAGNTTSAGLIDIRSCTGITLRDLHIDATGQFGVMLLGDPLADTSARIRLENLVITTRRAGASAPADLHIPYTPAAFPLNTVAAYRTNDVRILRCKLTMIGDLSPASNVLFNRCNDVVVRDCGIFTAPGTGDVYLAWGGVHIGDRCERVLLEHNEIEHGLGHGITLGTASVALESVPNHTYWLDPPGRLVFILDAANSGTSTCLPVVSTWPGIAEPLPVRLGENSKDVEIVDNRIRYFASSGISALGFLAPPATPGDAYTMLGSDNLTLRDNLVEFNCNKIPAAAPAATYASITAFGGVVLARADGLRIHDNIIQKNPDVGTARALCGIYVLSADNLQIEDNQIRENGKRPAEGSPGSGLRAGIALQLVGRRITSEETTSDDTLLPAARVRGNYILQPVGRALQMYGLGPMLIHGNVLVSQGLGLPPYASGAAHCIEIHNLGLSSDLTAIPAELAMFPSPPLVYNPGVAPGAVEDDFIDGRVLFTDNQVRFEPVDGEAASLYVATRVHSWGDAAVLGNQFLTRLPASGSLVVDTTVTGWSTRTSSNRWEDPIGPGPGSGAPQTLASLRTVGALNITALNQATSCIYVEFTTTTPLPGLPVANNQIYRDDCPVGSPPPFITP